MYRAGSLWTHDHPSHAEDGVMVSTALHSVESSRARFA